MRKYILAFILILCIGVALYSHAGMLVQTVASGASYSDIIYYHDCNALDDANKSGGSATVTYDSDLDRLVVDNSGTAILGADSWDTDNTATAQASIPLSGNVDFESGRLGLYFRPEDIGDGYVWATDGGDYIIRRSGDTIRLEIFSVSQTCSSTTLVATTTYFMEFKFTQSLGEQTIDAYIDGASISCSCTGTQGITNDTNLIIGDQGGGWGVWDGHYDQIISSNDADRDIDAVKTITNFD